MLEYFLVGIQFEQSGRHLTRDRPLGRKGSLDNKNQANQRFLSGHERYVCLFSHVKGIW